MNFDHFVNNEIQYKQIRLVSDDGNQTVITTYEALRQASNQGMDLVLINEQSVPPVCKIMDYSKFKYEQTKRLKEQAKKARALQVETKEIQLRPVTDVNDIEIKAKRAKEFLADGNRVKIIVKFKGREVSHSEMGRKVIDAFMNSVGDHKIERPINLMGRDMSCVIAPSAKSST